LIFEIALHERHISLDESYMIRYRLCWWLWCSNDAERNWSWPTTWKCGHKWSYKKCTWI